MFVREHRTYDTCCSFVPLYPTNRIYGKPFLKTALTSVSSPQTIVMKVSCLVVATQDTSTMNHFQRGY